MAASTGYGPRKELGSRWNSLCFDGDEKNDELWETKFLAHLRLLNLKSPILSEPPGEASEEFKTKLRSYESTEKFNAASSEDDSVMKVRGRDSGNMKLSCFNCGQKGHKAVECTSAKGEHRTETVV
ncbi:hypothetical protein D4764_04G0013910 [Takifugu flavidus]|uniref:CCHC-type domain-containing protein n=1 Tax=Takifugu flavidus TaxID=433684 RepID=A0A5C6N5K3_9TELE|nr:hypothetical protein D4764_04G0013910 [Takifugu flavidus]